MIEIDDGGPAFPGSFSGHCGLANHLAPCDCCVPSGMTLRDYFAGKVVVFFLARDPAAVAAKRAYDYADAMIAVRKLPVKS